MNFLIVGILLFSNSVLASQKMDGQDNVNLSIQCSNINSQRLQQALNNIQMYNRVSKNLGRNNDAAVEFASILDREKVTLASIILSKCQITATN